MSYVRGHHRRDGTYVRPHHRRARQATRATASHSAPASHSTASGPTTHVRGHYRDGSYVRPHLRRISPSRKATGGSLAVLLLLGVLAALSVGETSVPHDPVTSPTAPVSVPATSASTAPPR